MLSHSSTNKRHIFYVLPQWHAIFSLDLYSNNGVTKFSNHRSIMRDNIKIQFNLNEIEFLDLTKMIVYFLTKRQYTYLYIRIYIQRCNKNVVLYNLNINFSLLLTVKNFKKKTVISQSLSLWLALPFESRFKIKFHFRVNDVNAIRHSLGLIIFVVSWLL